MPDCRQGGWENQTAEFKLAWLDLILSDDRELCDRKPRDPVPADATKTYFIYCPATRRIKIGRAKDVRSRLRSLATAASSELVLVAATGDDRESMLHMEFAATRRCGEWFDLSVKLCEYVLTLGLRFAIDLCGVSGERWAAMFEGGMESRREIGAWLEKRYRKQVSDFVQGDDWVDTLIRCLDDEDEGEETHRTSPAEQFVADLAGGAK